MKYIMLMLLPSTPSQWLLLVLVCVVGWFTFALCSDKSWKSFEASNICGAFCGLSLFYGVKKRSRWPE